MGRVRNEFDQTLEWVKSNVVKAMATLSGLLAFFTALLQVYDMYENVRYIPTMKAEIVELRAKEARTADILSIAVDAISHEMETIDMGSYHVEETNGGDTWYITNVDGQRAIFKAIKNEKSGQYSYFNFKHRNVKLED